MSQKQVEPAKTSCTLCGSEWTTKVSCPLNPDAKPNHWTLEGVYGDRGNPLKHPNAVDMLRKRGQTTLESRPAKQVKKTNNSHAKSTNNGNGKNNSNTGISDFITKNFTLTQKSGKTTLNEPILENGKLRSSILTLRSDNSQEILDAVPELQKATNIFG